MSGVEAELIGGPADGTLLTVQDPAPRELIILEQPRPIEYLLRGAAAATAADLGRTVYLLRNTWNPRTRRRQYVAG